MLLKCPHDIRDTCFTLCILPRHRVDAWLRGFEVEGLLVCRFDRNAISLMDRGFIVAIAHVRGGGEMGRLW